jgi:hypothetical protein
MTIRKLIYDLQRLFSAACETTRLSAIDFLRRSGLSVIGFLLVLILGFIGVVWLSAGLGLWMADRWGWTSSAFFSGVLFLVLSGVVAIAFKKILTSTKTKPLLLPDQLRLDRDEAQKDLQESGWDVRQEASELLNPLALLERRIREHPTTFVLGSLTAGIILGFRSHQRPSSI